MSSTPNEPATPQQPGQDQPSTAPQYGASQPSAPQYGAPQPNASQPGPPQYGANPSAPQYGAPPAYGAQPGTPSSGYAGAPQWPGDNPSAPVARPQKVEIAFWLIIAAGVLNLVASLLGAALVGDTAQYRDLVRQVEQSGGTEDSLRSMITVMSIVIGVIQLGLYLLVAFFVRKGANWARILGTVFAALSLFSLVSGNVLNIIVVLMGIAAIVLLYLKDSSPYFAKRPKF